MFRWRPLVLALLVAGSIGQAVAGRSAALVSGVEGTGTDCARLLPVGSEATIFTVPSTDAGTVSAAIGFADGELLPFVDGGAGLWTVARSGAATEPGLRATVNARTKRIVLEGRWPYGTCEFSRLELSLTADAGAHDTVPGLLTSGDDQVVALGVDLEASMAADPPRTPRQNADLAVALRRRAGELFGNQHPVALRLAHREALARAEAQDGGVTMDATDAWIVRLDRDLGPASYQSLQVRMQRTSIDGVLWRDAAALESARRALAHGELWLSFDDPQLLVAILALAVYEWENGDPAAALRSIERVITRRDRLATQDLERAENQYGLILVFVGRYEEAIAVLGAGIAGIEGRGSRSRLMLANMLTNIGIAYERSGRMVDGTAAKQRAYLAYVEALGKDHPYSLGALHNMALSFVRLGQGERALPLMKEASEGFVRVRGWENHETILSVRGYAELLNESGQSADALPLLQQAQQAADRVLGPAHPVAIGAYQSLGSAQVSVGRIEEALQSFAEVERRQATLSFRTVDNAIVAYSIANAHEQRGDLEAADVHARRAIAIADEVRIAAPQTRLEALRLLARAAEARRDFTAAQSWLSSYVETFEQFRARNPLPEQSAAAFGARYAEGYAELAMLQARTGQTGAGFETVERYKARALLESLSRLAADDSALLEEADRLTLKRLRNAVSEADRQVLQASSTDARTIGFYARDQAYREYLDARAEIASRNRRYAAVATPSVVKAADADSIIDRDTCFVSYVVVAQAAGAFVHRRGRGWHFVPLEGASELAGRIEEYRTALSNPAFPAARRATIERDLSAALTAPMRQCREGARRLVVSPDGPLTLIPFETLRRGARRLADVYDVSYVQSLSVMALLKRRLSNERSDGDRRLLVFGAPSYGPAQDDSQTVLRTASLRGFGHSPDNASRAYAGLRHQWSALPGAEREARGVAKLFPGADLHLGEAANEEALQALNASGALARYRYLLFSTHGYLSSDEPSLSAVVLKQPGTASADGYVTAAEWPTYTLRSELIVLSACETGLGRRLSGEGVLGLPFAMFVAGNYNTVLSLWSVPDASTADFMVRFFSHVRSGKSVARALATAKREMLRAKPEAHPAQWAGFILIGH